MMFFMSSRSDNMSFSLRKETAFASGVIILSAMTPASSMLSLSTSEPLYQFVLVANDAARSPWTALSAWTIGKPCCAKTESTAVRRMFELAAGFQTTAIIVPVRFSQASFTASSCIRSFRMNFALLPQPMLGAALQTNGTSKKETSVLRSSEEALLLWAWSTDGAIPRYGNVMAIAARKVALHTPILFHLLAPLILH